MVSSEPGRALPILLLAVVAFAVATAMLADADLVSAILGWWPLVAAPLAFILADSFGTDAI